MGFTLRFMLGFALVLATCSVLDCASSWRYIRQVPPEAPDGISNVNETSKEENVSTNNATNNSGVAEELRPFNNKQKNEEETEKKPKTESSAEKYIRDNKINVNKTKSNGNGTVEKKTDHKNETNVEKPLLKDSDVLAEETRQNSLKKETDTEVVRQQKETTEKVPESKQVTPAIRTQSGRSLDMDLDISKYVSPEFHHKNNVYSFSVSPDTEKYTNLHNELPKSTTSRLPTQTPRETHFGVEITNPSDDEFDKRYQHIEDGVKQKLKYIDHQFANADYEFKKSEDEEATNISKIFNELKNNDTTISLNYTKFKSISNNNTQDKNKIHKEMDVELGQNVDYSSSYNKTHILDELPKDYRNKIPHEDEFKSDIVSELLPEHSDHKVHKPAEKPMDSKHLEPEEKIPEIINFKDSTSLTKPPSLNQSENHKSLLSNKIETEVVNPAENNVKLKWDFPYMSTASVITSTTTTIKPVTTIKSGQEEEAVYVPYTKENFINVSKRGSTKFVDTIKIPSTTESTTANRSRQSTVFKDKLVLTNKQALANKENKTVEQSVLENQVYPVQIPAPNTEEKDEKTINDTTEKIVTTEDATLSSLKLFSNTQTFTSRPIVSEKRTIENKGETTTLSESLTTLGSVSTTYTTNNSFDSATITTTNSLQETTTDEIVTEVSTVKGELETTIRLENLTTLSDMETTVSTVVPYATTLGIETAATNFVIKNEEFATTTYRIDSSTGSVEDSNGFSQESVSAETASSEEVIGGNSQPTESEYPEYSDSNTTTSSYEDSGSTSTKSSEYDERSNSGRDLKGNSHEASFSTIDESLNNVDLQSPPTTTDKNLNLVTTEEHVLLNKTSESTEENKAILNETISGTTSDYRENIIIKQIYSTSTTKRPEETNQELSGKNNVTESESEDEHESNEGETEDEHDGDLEVNEHSTLSPRNIRPNLDKNVSETTPFIVTLNVSMLETDSTDATTVGDNSELGSEGKVEGGGGPIAAIVISCIGAACLILLAGLLFVMRKRHKRFNYGQRCTPVSLDAYSVDNVSVYNSMRRKGAMRASKRSYGNPAFDDPSSTSHPMNFPALAKFAGNVEGITAEFEEIPQVTAQTNELPEGCETKNRYANVIPLPETRVFLSAIDGYPNSDYINANYVTGPKSSRGYYIACQAPMQNTVDDFWRMVWEQQSKVILMLTHLFENGTEKCVDYLPPSEVLDCHRLFGDFQVTLKKREVKEKYVISSLQLKNMVSNSWREVTHLWYLGWPEKGVPLEANSLIAFLIEARSYIKAAASPAENGKPKETSNDQVSNGSVNPEQPPVIVHCSPGTGRTGTVIACDIAIREFELVRQVDIPKTVYRIRRDRASSVQTKEQYGFIYTVICLYATKLTGGVLDSL